MQPVFNSTKGLITDITGLMNLNEFISFILNCDGLVANSAGPLYIATALGKDTLRIYPPMRPLYAGRWGPVGTNIYTFTLEDFCERCKKNDKPCECIMQVDHLGIKSILEKIYKYY